MMRASSPRTPQNATSSSTVTLPPRDRHAAARAGEAKGLTPTVARWPLEVDSDFETACCSDAALAVVRSSIAAYRAGRADSASRGWHDEIVWKVRGAPPAGGEWVGADGVFDYHARLVQLSDGTFQQRLVALEGSRGSIVNAYLRTTATRAGRTLDIPTLAVFELAGGRVRRVAELPGDLLAWEAFWAD